MQIFQLDSQETIEYWHSELLDAPRKNDFIFLSHDIANTIWFVTNYIQFLSRSGNSEITQVYGKHVNSLEDFIYQVNYSLPVGGRLKTNIHALYDLLLNFETEPLRRIIVWTDANSLFTKSRVEFENIFDVMVAAAYCNRNAISTIKENGERYKVDQRNLFFFQGIDYPNIQYLIEKKYHIPSLDEPDLEMQLEFDVVNVF